MAANILARNFKVPLRDFRAIDISADVHVWRVFARLGLIEVEADVDRVIWKARELYPSFPGLMDLPTWWIGREWCHARRPACDDCYMGRLCPRIDLPQ